MNYEIVNLEEKTVAGISARTSNASPDMREKIGELWSRFYGAGIYDSIPDKVNSNALGLYTGYAEDGYTAAAVCEVSSAPAPEELSVFCIPAGRYAKFTVYGDMVQAVNEGWKEIWKTDLPRAFQCDFEEYDGSEKIHIYIGLKG